MVKGRPISQVRLSNHFRLFNPSTVAIISASVDDGEPTRSLELLEPRKDLPSFIISSPCDYSRYDVKSTMHHNVRKKGNLSSVQWILIP